MPHSFVSNNIHIVFSTKERRPLIPISEQKRLWAYMAGIAKNMGVTPMAVGGMPDHVHVLVALPADLPIARFVNVLKSNSSKWMNERGVEFGWQKGYAAFSVSSAYPALTGWANLCRPYGPGLGKAASFLLYDGTCDTAA